MPGFSSRKHSLLPGGRSLASPLNGRHGTSHHAFVFMNASLEPAQNPGPSHTRLRGLRNTYGLLALSLFLAVLGAWIGINLRVTEGITGITALLVLLLGGVGFSMLLNRWRHARAGLLVLAAFTFFTGLMLSLTLVRWLGFYTTGNSLMTAFAGAAAVMSAAAAATSLLRSALSPLLQVSLTIAVLVLVTGAAEWLLRSSTQVIVWSVLAGGVLAAAMLYLQHHLAARDLAGSEGAAPTGPVEATVEVFLGLLGGFQSLSALIGRTDDSSTT
jgi:modulator of FtsH protease